MSTMRGFVPTRKLGGGAAITKKFPVSAASNNAYFLGDAVKIGASGKVRPMDNLAASIPLGVIVGFEDSNGKPLTHNLPTSGPYLATAVNGYAFVNIDPQQVYKAQFNGNFTDAVRFGGTRVSAGTPNTLTGLSGMTLNGTAITSAAHFKILGLAAEESISGATSVASPALVEVIIHNPFSGGGNPI